jgi:hypothetical protein
MRFHELSLADGLPPRQTQQCRVVPCTRTSGAPAPSRQHPIEVPSAERIRSIPSSVMAGDSVPGAPYRFFGRSEMLCIEA